ncbi:hypothetical protein L6R50_09405 [Myxococcota bacterium]|nr:hypothetical protein [Myxococcota bacterium]
MKTVEVPAGAELEVEVDLHAFRAQVYVHYDGAQVLVGDGGSGPVRAPLRAPDAEDGRLVQWTVNQSGGGVWRFEVRLLRDGSPIALLDERMGDASALTTSGLALLVGTPGAAALELVPGGRASSVAPGRSGDREGGRDP